MADMLFIATMAIILTVISSGLALVVWNSSRQDFRKPFALMMFSQILIVWAYLLDITSATLEGKLFWNNLEYFGYLLGIGAFVLFALQYSRSFHLTPKLGLLLGAPAIFFLMAVILNPIHHLFYTSVVISPNFYKSFVAIYGPLFYAYVAYISIMMLVGLAILGKHYMQASNAHRRSVGITFFACLLNALAISLNFVTLSSVPGGVVLALGFLASNLFMFIGAFGFELFSMVPFGLDRVMNTTRSIVFILDDKDMVLYQNAAADSLVGMKADGKHHITDLLTSFPPVLLHGNKAVPREEEDVHLLLPGRFFDVTVLLILDHSGMISGKTVMLREMTAQRAAEADARMANYKLDLMNSITRHDVMNQLTILEGNLMLASMKTDPTAVQGHISTCYTAAMNIQRQMDFARQYQDIDKRVPVWQDVGERMREMSSGMDLRGTRLDINVRSIEVLADPLLDKVLYNLIDNSLAHGGQVTVLTLASRETEHGLELVYTDDGAGIPAHMKAKLFTKGFGTNNGLGLYLSREILAHSQMTITEEGRPGRGARFVIRVPSGRYRKTDFIEGLGATNLAPAGQPAKAAENPAS